jgi:hypothetical protein
MSQTAIILGVGQKTTLLNPFLEPLMSYAVLVLEQPWWNISIDPGQTSVRHFLDGLARLEDLSIFHATFFDTRSFDLALQHLLDARKLEDIERVIVYVASHGAGGRIGNGHGPSMNLSTVFDLIRQHGKSKVAGLILDSCEVGGEFETIKSGMKKAKICWTLGYQVSVGWLSSTLINLHVLSVMSRLELAKLTNRYELIAGVQTALELFNPYQVIAADEDEDNITFLSEALTVVIRLPQKNPELLLAEEIWPELAEEEED